MKYIVNNLVESTYGKHIIDGLVKVISKSPHALRGEWNKLTIDDLQTYFSNVGYHDVKLSGNPPNKEDIRFKVVLLLSQATYEKWSVRDLVLCLLELVKP